MTATLQNFRREPAQTQIQTVKWPAGWAPTPGKKPKSSKVSDLSAYKGYSIAITWTVAEAETLASLFTPGISHYDWIQFQPDGSETTAYLYPITINKHKVLVMKSQVHLDYQGPKPVMSLFEQIAKQVNPDVFITTGTAGGISNQVKLGDVVISENVRFYCTGKYKKEPWANRSFPCAPVPEGVAKAFSPAITSVNALQVGAMPELWYGKDSDIVTTDVFAFDDSTDYYKLQGKGRACEMDDAMVAMAMHEAGYANKFYAIRNASDPQIPNPTNDIKSAHNLAGSIYQKYGLYTSAASVIASWAVLACNFGYKP